MGALRASVSKLIDSRASLLRENHSLRSELDNRERRIAALEAELKALEEKKRRVGERIDSLISQIDALAEPEHGRDGAPAAL